MGNDLISRSALLIKMTDRTFSSELQEYRHYQNIVKNMPTAYDVDKVMERLETESQNIELIYPTDQGYDYEDAIGIDINKAKQIVKSGGIE